MSDGELFIIGRIKDLLIVDGRNHYPDDIEATIQEITGGRVAAIAVADDGTEQLVAIIELKQRGDSDDEPCNGSAPSNVKSRRRYRESHSLRVADLVLVPPGFDPDHHQRQDPPVGVRGAVPAGRIRPLGRCTMTANIDEAELRNWLIDYLVTNIGCNADHIDVDLPLNELGVGSRDAVVLSGELSELLDRPVSPMEFWQHPTINALTQVLDHAGDRPRRGCGSGALGPHGVGRADRRHRAGLPVSRRH